ncbi:MAG: amidase [Gemmatales bacterium]|nr:amidase [Gemmatales bacterium]MDW8385996.1 amidase [Gemmatales bacterium]
MELFPDSADTLESLAAKLATGRLTCRQLVERCLQRIEEREAEVRAWVLVDAEGARRQADERDRELKNGLRRGPLHGIPLGIKDLFDVQGWPTKAGSRLLGQSPAVEDAVAVARLRSAGAVLLGKTVTTPYASFDPPPTRNPWNPARTPGGSSSGSAAAVAVGMCLAALGSQTGGSITRPASYCGVAGCKPTYGLISVRGVFPLAPSMDHVGPLGRCVADLACLLEVIADVPLHRLARSEAPPPRLGRLGGFFRDLADPETWELFERILHRLSESGATVQDVPLPPSFIDIHRQHRIIMAVEAAAFHQERFRQYPDDYPAKITQLLTEGLNMPAVEYAKARQEQERAKGEILDCFRDCDVLAAPATTGPAPDRATTGDPAFNSPWSFTHLPVVSLPIGLSSQGLPLAMQLIGRPFEEARLFAAAVWCEEQIRQAMT